MPQLMAVEHRRHLRPLPLFNEAVCLANTHSISLSALPVCRLSCESDQAVGHSAATCGRLFFKTEEEKGGGGGGGGGGSPSPPSPGARRRLDATILFQREWGKVRRLRSAVMVQGPRRKNKNK